MSWVERIEKGIEIITGDGKKYTPLYMKSKKDMEYHVSEFNFVNIPGTLADRRERIGDRYVLELFFQGEDNVEKGREFEKSADNKKPWRVSHPIYDTLILQPSSISVDNTGLNVSKYTVNCIETLTDVNPKIEIDPVSQISSNVLEQQESSATEFDNVVDPKVSDLNQLTNNTQNMYDEGVKLLTTNEERSDYFNAFEVANAAILNGTSDTLKMIRSVQAVIEAPALFEISVKSRLNNLKNQMSKLIETLDNITTKNEKKIFENNAGGLLMAMVTAAANPIDGDYENSTDVLSVADTVLDQYDTYIDNLNTLQSDNNFSEDDYIPGFDSISGATVAVEYALSNLLQIALGAKQERSVILEYDSNLINLTHRFYGLNADDSNIKSFKKINNIGISEILSIKKGRKLIYFI